MKKIIYIFILFPFISSAQWYDGQGYFPIDSIFTFNLLDTSVIKIPQNSIWQISQYGKVGFPNNDSSKVIVTDTNRVNVKNGTFYFDLSLPNYLITGDTTHNIIGNPHEFWNYDIFIVHKHNIIDQSLGRILFRNVSTNQFDTLSLNWAWSYNNQCYFPTFYNYCNNYSGIFQNNCEFDYTGGIVNGQRDSIWIHTDIGFRYVPSKKMSRSCDFSLNYNYDTTTVRFLYTSVDSLSGGPGWMIKSIKIVTYICTQDCPSQIDKSKIDVHAIDLYPNPSSTYINLKLNGYTRDQIDLNLYDCIGKEYKTAYRKNGDNYIFNIEDLPKGIYSLIIRENNSLISKRFIKVD